MGDQAKRAKRPRRAFTDEFKAGAVRLVIEEGKSIAAVARDLDLTASAVSRWVEQARAEKAKGKSAVLTSAEREELTRLRREVRQLKMDREILKKAAVHSTGRRNGGL